MPEDEIFGNLKNTLPKRLKEAREKQKLTQAKLSEKTGADTLVNNASISDYENGKKIPTLESIYRLAQSLGVSIDWLCGYEIDKTDTISVPVALMTVLKKLNPRIESEPNGTSVKLVFDYNFPVKKFFDEYSAIINAENQNIFPEHMMNQLKKNLLKDYDYLPNLPDYSFDKPKNSL